MSSLMAVQGLHVGRRFNLGEQTRIGRASDNEIALADHLVSRYHAEITRRGIYFDVRDLGSKNGIQVNGANVLEKRLYRGDSLTIGQTVFTFEAPLEPRAARFSETMVTLAAQSGAGVRIHEHASLPLPPQQAVTDFLLRLGRLFDCAGDEVGEQLNSTLRQLMELFSASAGSILLRSSSGEAIALVAVARDGQLRLGQEAVSMVLNEGKAILAPAPAPALAEPAEIPRNRPRRVMMVPLLRRERVMGAIHLEQPEGREFTAEDLGLLQALARLLTGALHHAIQSDQMVLVSAASPSPYVGISPVAESIRAQIRRVAAGDSTVLLTGETGTGKELVAKAIHAESSRAARALVAIDCSSIPANLMESEIFGHEAGAFTGADQLKRGKVEMAEGGTLFLDEIGELHIDLQPKLLRFIEELTFYRVGGVKPIPCDVRIIAATNRDLEKAVAEGRFRQDLLFRLNVLPLSLAPLRAHPEDIRPLVEHFAPRLAARLGKPFLGLVDEAWAILERYPWPGNVRELHHGLERAMILSDDGILRPEHFQLILPDSTVTTSTTDSHTQTVEKSRPARARDNKTPPSLAEVEADAIRRALRYAGGNRLRAAEVLQIHRNTLAKKIQEYGLDQERPHEQGAPAIPEKVR